jgi:CHAD domain-containing protein
LELEPAVRAGDDIEAVHDMRVAGRRLREAGGLFRDFLPSRALTLRRELRWAADVLGSVRDLDVQREQLAQWIADAEPDEADALRALDVLLSEQRGVAQTRLVRALDSKRFERLRHGFVEMIRRGPSRRDPMAKVPLVVVVPDLVAKRYRQVRKAGEATPKNAPEAALHRFRVRCKRLRYAIEFIEPVYPEPSVAIVRRLVRLQDVLGGIHDAEIASAHLRDLRARSPRLSPDLAFAMGRVAERYTRRAAKLRARVPSAFEGVRGKRWKEIKRTMERGRGAGRVLLPSQAKDPKTVARPAPRAPAKPTARPVAKPVPRAAAKPAARSIAKSTSRPAARKRAVAEVPAPAGERADTA